MVYGSGVIDIEKVVTYEIYELGNTDIADYLLSHYKEMLSDKTISFLENIANNDEYLDTTDEDTICKIVTRTINEINRFKGKKYRYALWLADKDAVISLYGASDDADIDAYETSDFVLNDLRFDGTLYAYEDVPLKL